ncbi:hypothetical protein LB561_07425 [Mesorhizobium sp. B292B1B]|uniref:hypothetical protein n=2 Tax=unclassified Mesorhizobium TaxID=325217 RepID=UPI001CD172B3|nr:MULTISPECIES: hypothetical protein [unclassified Mesorhizobium]MCA0037122.1 hypothetical protein [Mesorhizobium sp. B292B1B]
MGLEPDDAQAGTIQTVAQNRTVCRVEISLELIAARLAMEPSATVPAPLMAAAAMLIPRNQDHIFVFVPVVVAVCFRYVNSAGGLYPLHAA